MTDFRPMRVRAYLLDGRIAGTEPWFPLDSILAAEWVRRNHPEAFYDPPPPGRKDGWVEADLAEVLERRGNGDRWYWACSFNQRTPLKEYVAYWHRRFDAHMERYLDFQGKRGKIDTKSGRNKGYRMPLNVMLFDYLEWFAVGDPAAVEELLVGMTALGKKPAQGYGMVDCWEIEPWRKDWSEVGPDGGLTRAVYELPEGADPRLARRRIYGMRPPYWQRWNQAEVWMPRGAR